MSIINDIQGISDSTSASWCQGVRIGGTIVEIDEYIGIYDDDADETTGYPITLADGSTIAGDQDRDELRALLKPLGLTTETDDEGLILIQRETAY